MLLKLRHQTDEAGKTPKYLQVGLRGFRMAGTHPTLYHLGVKFASFGSRLIASHGWIKRLPGPLSHWTQSRDFPVFAKESFSTQLKKKRRRTAFERRMPRRRRRCRSHSRLHEFSLEAA